MKKETLEEVAERYNSQFLNEEENKFSKEDFINGAKWMREKMYSEKDMRKAYCRGYIAVVKSSLNDCFYEWFEQYKNK